MNLIAPDGTVGWVEDAQVPEALKAGYREATPADVARAKAGESPVQAGLEGLARGATAGISDAVLTGYYKGRGEDPGQVLARKEENPAASLTGEIAGILMPGPTAANAITKVGNVAKGVVAGKTAGRAIQGVTEAGLWGLGTVISEDALHDQALTAENLGAGVLSSTLVGGGTNVVFGKVGDLGRSALVKAFGGGALKNSLEDLAAKATMRQVTLPSDRSKDFLRARSQDIGKFVAKEGITRGAPTMAEAARRAEERAGKAADEVTRIVAELDNKGVEFDPFKLRSRVEQEIIQPMLNTPSKTESVAMLREWLDKFFKKVEVPNISSDINAPKTRIELVPRVKSFSKVRDELQALRSKISERDPKFASQMDDLFKSRGGLQEEFFDQAGELGDALRKANDDLAKASKFRQLAQKAADRQEQNRGISLTDYIVGSSAGHLGGTMFGPLGIGAGVAGSLANKFMRERGGFVAANALEMMAGSKVLNRIADGLAKTMEKQLKANAGFGGPFRTMLEVAAAKGSMDLLTTHVGLAQTDPEYLAAVGMQPEDPNIVADYADKAHRLGTLANSTEQMQAGIDKAIDRVMGSARGRPAAPPKVSMSVEEYRATVQKLRELAMNSDSIKKQIAEIAPVTAGMSAVNIVKAAQYLLEKAPKDPNEHLPPALQRPWSPTRQELATWNRCVRAVGNPASVFEDIQHGTVTPEGIEALRTVYPRLYQEFKDRMMSRLGDLAEPLERKKRAQVQVILGDLDDPRQVALIQAMHARNKPSQPQKPDGREKIDVQRNLLTQGQRLENKSKEDA